MEDRRNIVLEINEKNEIIRIHRNRAVAIGRIADKTLYWKNPDLSADIIKSVEAFLVSEGIKIEHRLLEGQKLDEIPKNAPPRPLMHFMQGDCTPAVVEWLEKYAPIEFQNTYGVVLLPLAEGQAEPANPRDRWMRADVIRTDSRPLEETKGGEYLATRFKMRNQIIARRRTHITFEKKEIFKGDTPAEQALPYDDPYTPQKLAQMEKRGEIEIVYRRHAAASAGNAF